MAITKERKDELVSRYVEWVNQSKALILTEYKGLTMKQIDDLRSRTREAGGEFHIVKNTLSRVAFESAGLTVPEKLLEGSTAVAFAFKDAPALAKTMTDFAKTSDFVKIKGGFLEKRAISSVDVKALADLPPLPVMRAQLLGTLLAPAGKLVRTLAEPARSFAAVLQAYVDQQSASTSA
ncbi:MAG TPA: 50S ribosomal protein L10 [Anaerolineales bacterium]